MMLPPPLPRAFYARDTVQVARELLGHWLVHEHDGVPLIGRIVETESYLGPEDQAAHSARGRTERNAAMFGPPGHAYVYLIYGMWHCMNVVTREVGVPHAVLIRAVQPICPLPSLSHTHGPGLLCRAMHITRQHNAVDLCASVLSVRTGDQPVSAEDIVSSTRIGIDYAGDWAQRPWRFYLRSNPHVSTLTTAQRRQLHQRDADKQPEAAASSPEQCKS